MICFIKKDLQPELCGKDVSLQDWELWCKDYRVCVCYQNNLYGKAQHTLS